MDTSAEPFFASNSTQHAAWIVVVTITFLIYAVGGVVAVLVVRKRTGSPRFYDLLLIGALLVSLAQAVVLIRACHDGLGTRQLTMSSSSIDTVHKVWLKNHAICNLSNLLQEYFTTSIMLVVVHALAKLSASMFFLAINARPVLKRTTHLLMIVIALWAVSSIILLAVRCGTSVPWSRDDDSCRSYSGVYIGIDVGNIVTDLVLVVLPMIMMWDLQTNMQTKIHVIALFASRLL
jgi:hypothetical protein